PRSQLRGPGMRIPRASLSVRGLMIAIAGLALLATVFLQQRELGRQQRELKDARTFQSEMIDFAQFEMKMSGQARRDAALRATFGDLGLAILRARDQVEVVRVRTYSQDLIPTAQILDVVPTGQTLDPAVSERLADVFLDQANYDMFCSAMPTWLRGVRIWR